MDKAQLDPLAEIFIESYLDTATFSRMFKEEHDQPPTVLAKAHHFRSVVQAVLRRERRYDLSQDFMEFGRVEVTDHIAGRAYLLRSYSAIAVETAKRGQRETLFHDTDFTASDVTMLVYRFDKPGLDLSVAGTRRNGSKWRLQPVGVPVYVGTWPYHIPTPPSFDQEEEDAFNDVGDIDIDGEVDEQ